MSMLAVLAVALTSALVLARPRIGAWRIGPASAASAGVFVLAAGGFVATTDAWDAAVALGPAVIGIAAMMTLSAACVRLGALELLAATVEARAGRSTVGLFLVVFAGAWLTAGVLNNDAAVIVNSALVASLLRRRFVTRPEVAEPFLLAVFLGAGVAPLVISNPMNLTVAHLAGIGFIEYARIMIPVSAVGAVVTLLVMLAVYRRQLRGDASERRPAIERSQPAVAGIIVIVVVLCGYVPAAALSLPSWIVSLTGALVALALVRRMGGSTRDVVVKSVSLEILCVLPVVFVFAAALERAGLIDWLRPLLVQQGGMRVGLASAAGSALLNNHTMGLINVNVLVHSGASMQEVLAALVGGDLGPRLLPFGSLAGLLWLDALKQQGLEIPMRRFVAVGVLTGVPALLACLVALRLFH